MDDEEEEGEELSECKSRRREGKWRGIKTEGGRGRDGGNDYEWKRSSLNQDMDANK